MSDGVEKGREDLRIGDGVLGEFGGDDESTGLDGQMKLLPALGAPLSMFGRCPFSLPEDLQFSRVEKNMEGSASAELRSETELKLPTSSDQRGMVGNVKVTEAEEPKKRADEAFGLAPRQRVLETEEKSELDDGIRVSPRSASPAGLSRLPRTKKIG